MPESRSACVDRTGVAVIRIWVEQTGVRDGLRARISLVPDIESGETTTVVAGGRHELLGAVRLFVDEFAARANLGGDAAVTADTETPGR
jgi:hypothetical protein